MTEPASVPPYPSVPPREVVARFQNYSAAESAVDLLADKDFEVSTVHIVGHDLQSVETVTGDMNYGKAALYGAGSGAWIGLLIGLVLALFVPLAGIFGTLLWTVILGAIWGLVFGLIAFAVTGNRRNFRSVSSLQAQSYTVEVDHPRAAEAVQILARGR